MSDDKVNGQNYSFPQDEGKQKYSMSPIGGTESIKSIFKNKRLMKSFGGVFLVYLILQGIIYMFVPDDDAGQSAPIVTENIQADIEQQSENATEVKEKVVEPVVNEVSNQNIVFDEVHQQELDQVAFDLSEQSLEVKRLKAHIRDLEKKQQDLIYNLNVLERKFENNMGNVMSFVEEQRTLQSKKIADKKAKSVKKQKKILQTYHTKAVIHGRAWLVKKGTNDSISISVGDNIPTYGKVTMIDVDSGKVYTSSGRIIAFGF